ncbi:1-deoxy-D-xylulose 5-phosphate reducto-isomerase [Theileria orientalis]|uniref:1-deoxy-D-xylulose 5-phosphate reductoisomerase, apicoplastic n=1 Tax=Theileria orientalis TaxID=68886 RepID=A0A976QUY8_THEOR|nr:1-deoxy-D-xylulose 5-phosphate reducto-isomerase [Theileria orientalis]
MQMFSKTNLHEAKLCSPVKVAIVGSTGSVGTQALNVIRNLNKNETKFEVVALTARKNFELLSQQADEFMPKACHIFDNSDRLKESMRHKCDVLTSKQDLLDLCQNLDYDVLLMAISGCAGIEPTLSAARSGKKLALSNKESVVSAGKLLSRIVKESATTVIPVDSEHNAIFQCLDDGSVDARRSSYVCNISQNSLQRVKNLILTSSGGPFRGSKFSDYKSLKMKDNISHPVWSMGSKITVDSSTMMNKALEVIEAHHLFGIPFENIKILIHKECIVHSMVEFVDNSVLAQMYLPDMCLPISHALNWPNRSDNGLPGLDLTKHTLSFTEADMENFPFLKLGYEVGRRGGLYPAVFNAANDMANELFRQNLINYDQLHELVHDTVDLFNPFELKDDRIEDILLVDSWAKRKVRQLAQNT